MDILTTYFAIAIVVSLSAFCWWHTSRSQHGVLVKIVLVLLAALPLVGPLMYIFVHAPPRTVAQVEESAKRSTKSSLLLKRFNEREHVYLAWASCIFWMLAILAYWMNDWKPGHIIDGPIGSYTTVDAIFFSLLIVAVFTFGAAVRAKVVLERRIREASNSLLQATGQTRPAPE